MINLLFGPSVQDHLDILIEAMRVVWGSSYPLYPYAINELISYGGLSSYFRWIGNLLDLELSHFTVIPHTDDGLEPEEWFIPIDTVAMPLTDPFHTRKLQELVKRCGKDRANVCKKPTTAPPLTRSREKRIVTFRQQSRPLNLPVDVCEIILDELSAKPVDAANAVDAFRWQLPDERWRRRLPLDVLPELDGIASTTDSNFDWRCFFIGFYRIFDDSHSLANRKRTFTVINAVHDVFLCKLESDRSEANARN